jgi:hypothetical protein
MQYLETSEFVLAITLQYHNFELVRFKNQDSRRIIFCFKETDELKEAVNAFWRGELRVEPKLFYQNQKMLRSRIHNI